MNFELTLYFITSIIAVAFYNFIASILSKKFKIEYAIFSVGSILIYGLFPVIITNYTNAYFGLTCSIVMGLFDSSLGFNISKKIKPFTKSKELLTLEPTPTLIVSMVFLTCVVGFVSILIFANSSLFN